jgi:hypothetical protein
MQLFFEMEENVRERVRVRASEQPRDGKNTSPFLERERERESLFAGFWRRKTERGVRDGVVRVIVLKLSLCRSCAPSTRALKGKETGLFLS